MYFPWFLASFSIALLWLAYKTTAQRTVSLCRIGTRGPNCFYITLLCLSWESIYSLAKCTWRTEAHGTERLRMVRSQGRVASSEDHTECSMTLAAKGTQPQLGEQDIGQVASQQVGWLSAAITPKLEEWSMVQSLGLSGYPSCLVDMRGGKIYRESSLVSQKLCPVGPWCILILSRFS